jgi:uncharacterized protein YkwD
MCHLKAARLLFCLAIAGCAAHDAADFSKRHDAQPDAQHAAVHDPSRPLVVADDLARRIHTLVNAERARKGLPALGWDESLARIAAGHSHDMASRQFLSHDSPEGDGFDDRYRQADYVCRIRDGRIIHLGAENIALGHLIDSVVTRNGVAHVNWNSRDEIARRAVDGWMRSSGHRKNILAPQWRNQGIGVGMGADDKVYVTQNFC